MEQRFCIYDFTVLNIPTVHLGAAERKKKNKSENSKSPLLFQSLCRNGYRAEMLFKLIGLMSPSLPEDKHTVKCFSKSRPHFSY